MAFEDLDLSTVPVRIISDTAFDKLTELLDNPDPKPNQALIDLMKRPKRWANTPKGKSDE